MLPFPLPRHGEITELVVDLNGICTLDDVGFVLRFWWVLCPCPELDAVPSGAPLSIPNTFESVHDGLGPSFNLPCASRQSSRSMPQ